MKAYIRHKFGGPEVLQIGEIEKPTPADDEILVRIKAISVNPVEWHRLRGTPFFMRLATGPFKPRNKVIGSDFAGIVEAVGTRVTKFEVDDEVFGEASLGSFGEYICVKLHMLARKPENASFEEAACLGVAGLTALQGIRDYGKLRAGEKVLINGAAGGVGHYSVQIAKALGAEITAVCSTGNIDFVRSIGAGHVVDYRQQDIHQHNGQYDLVVDVHGNLNFSDYRRMGGRGVMIGFVGMGHMLGLLLRKAFGKIKIEQFTAQAKGKDLAFLAKYYSEGKLRTNLDRTFSFEQLPEAIAFIERMHTRGKVAVRY
ncbi:NAD(P)-dependent alcohol dehydrogenase [Fulvivirgaceae bacterium BMA12]|uniref:NAD(P)-dependent alcohol dehydrogenase n=1 Tax=Agaribacillus aureus TaxID=3051825 RepID=A0ABT8L0P4_9BACT|nr:NAD(P)-dependent alcohol dehydrogenase [Fulvivirgaceae bacterium BMA12]